jgi:hypothetical protein
MRPVLLLIGVVLFSVYAQSKKFNHFESFENVNFLQSWEREEACCKYSITRTDSVAVSGKYALRFELNASDSLVANGKRAELVWKTDKKTHTERWFAFKVMLPSNYQADTIQEIIAQWHEVPDFNLGETWRVPPISLRIKNGRWLLDVRWATEAKNTNATISGNKVFDLGPIETDVWTSWNFNMLLTHTDNGKIKVWKNNVELLDYQGPNYYNDKSGPFFKIGIYKAGWKKGLTYNNVSKRIIFVDDVSISFRNRYNLQNQTKN